jgi:uncharacterized RDD family membrane protein YckC
MAEPMPAAGASQWGPLASWADRVIAALVDWVPVAILNYLTFRAGALGGLLGLVGTAYGFYIRYMEGEIGATPGKRLMGLKVVKIADGQTLGGGMGIVRYLAHIVDAVVCFLGFLLPLVDAQRQTIADKIIGTVVLRDQPKEQLTAEIFKIPNRQAG